jgi:hypothetical protein
MVHIKVQQSTVDNMPICNHDLTGVTVEHAQSVPGMAHFAGTGPNGKTCGQCEFWGYQVNTHKGLKFQFRCKKYNELMKKDGGIIPGLTLSCKYWEAKFVEPTSQQRPTQATDRPFTEANRNKRFRR